MSSVVKPVLTAAGAIAAPFTGGTSLLATAATVASTAASIAGVLSATGVIGRRPSVSTALAQSPNAQPVEEQANDQARVESTDRARRRARQAALTGFTANINTSPVGAAAQSVSTTRSVALGV